MKQHELLEMVKQKDLRIEMPVIIIAHIHRASKINRKIARELKLIKQHNPGL